jgi:hypothetical protein
MENKVGKLFKGLKRDTTSPISEKKAWGLIAITGIMYSILLTLVSWLLYRLMTIGSDIATRTGQDWMPVVFNNGYVRLAMAVWAFVVVIIGDAVIRDAINLVSRIPKPDENATMVQKGTGNKEKAKKTILFALIVVFFMVYFLTVTSW